MGEDGTGAYPRFLDNPTRLGGTIFLTLLAVYLAWFYSVWWALALVALEIFYFALRPVWTALDAGVDYLRGLLAPFKRIRGALIGLPLLFLGLYLGAYFPDSVGWLADGVNSVVRVISKSARYVIFFTLTPAIASTLAVGRAGKFALWVTGAYVALTLAAGVLALAILLPLFGLRLSGEGAEGAPPVQSNLGELLFNSPEFLAIFAAVGIGLMIHGLKMPGLFTTTRFFGGKLVDLLGDILKIALPLVLFALGSYIPTRLAAGIAAARRAGDLEGAGWAGNLSVEAAYFVAVGALVLILGVWIGGFAFIVMRRTGFPMPRFINDYFLDVFSYAWATASSSATIPLNLERAGDGLKVRQNVREFIIPLGATVHLDGTMIGGMVTTVIAAQLVGYTPTILDLLYVLVPLMIVTVGAPGVPGGLAIVGAPVIANLLPIPPGTAEAFTAIFVGFNLGLSDQFRSGVNATGNGVLCRLFEHWYPKKFAKPEDQTTRGQPSPVAGTDPPVAKRVRKRRPQQS